MAPGLTRRHVPEWQRYMTAAAWLLVLSFACVPALSRVHDRLTLIDQSAGFKPSKNLERPHDRNIPVALVVTHATVPDAYSSRAGDVGIQGRRAVAEQTPYAPRPLRAPPSR